MNNIVILFILGTLVAEAQNASATEAPRSKLADSLYRIGNYSQAIAVYKKTDEIKNAFQIAKSYENLGNSDKALHFLELALEKDPENQLTLSNYGKLLASAGKLKKADSIFADLISLYPTNPNNFYQRGLVSERLGDSTALMFYLNATLLDKNHQNSIYRLARYHVSKRNFMASNNFIERGLKLNPRSTRFIRLDALMKYHVKEYHQAIVAFERLLELNQSNIQLHENLADSYMNTNNFEKAIDQYRILINEYNDKSPAYHLHIGRAFMAIRENETAIHHIELSIALQQVALDREYLMLANIYKRNGDYKNVFEMLKLALEENPEEETLHYQYAIGADNYFEDKEVVLKYYEKYLSRFGDSGRFRDLAKQRVSDLKEELHFSKD